MSDAEKAKSLFLDAIERDPSGASPPTLDGACGGDAALRARVEQLLEAHRVLGVVPSPAVVTLDHPSADRAGTTIGPYKLLEEIGEGGMGQVFMAEQTTPVRRKVALKIIKPGMDSRQVIARFEAERQALAMMDHPNIARVLDAGATESGRPYFVMELVKGIPITDYCDRERLPVRERLELFVLVCRAVQHAHQKGIIHRDIKPTNVLITLHDGVPVPKVIDFGIAKATGQSLTDKTLYTGFAQLVGTPMYMSPEQAEISGLDIDTRSDIYSLGVLLYELLTGTTPFDSEMLRKAAFDEMRRIIREEEPQKPSTRLSTLGETLSTVSAKRGADSRKLNRTVRGDLDWVVMRALEKDRKRRYETANDFASDVMRYLTDQPVEACPPSVRYRLRKYGRRNRVMLTAAGAIALALVVGMAVSAWQAFEANKARRDGASEAAVATAINDFLLEDLLHQAASESQADRGFTADPDLTVRVALNRASAAIGTRFRGRPRVEAAIRRVIGMAYLGLAESKLAVDHLEQAVALDKTALGPTHPETLLAMHCLTIAYLDSGRHSEAVTLGEETLAKRRETLGLDHLVTLNTASTLAEAYRLTGRAQEAIGLEEQLLSKSVLGPDAHQALSTMNNLAIAYLRVGRSEDALTLSLRALEKRRETFGPDHPKTLVEHEHRGLYLTTPQSESARPSTCMNPWWKS